LQCAGRAKHRSSPNLDYNARGQRIRCENQNGTVTTYQYNPKTFRLTQLLTVRGSNSKLQYLVYNATASLQSCIRNNQ